MNCSSDSLLLFVRLVLFFLFCFFAKFVVQVWYGSVIRGDRSKVMIGFCTSVQDKTVLNTVSELESGFSADIQIGHYTTISEGALLTSCTIGDFVQVGAGAIVQEGCIIQDKVVIAPGSVLLPATFVSASQFWAGNPAVYVRDVTDEETTFAKHVSSFVISPTFKHAIDLYLSLFSLMLRVVYNSIVLFLPLSDCCQELYCQWPTL